MRRRARRSIEARLAELEQRTQTDGEYRHEYMLVPAPVTPAEWFLLIRFCADLPHGELFAPREMVLVGSGPLAGTHVVRDVGCSR